MKRSWILMLFVLMFAAVPVLTTGCQEGPLEEAAEEIEDEVDDATTD